MPLISAFEAPGGAERIGVFLRDNTPVKIYLDWNLRIGRKVRAQ
jgi:hypothetical protein